MRSHLDGLFFEYHLPRYTLDCAVCNQHEARASSSRYIYQYACNVPDRLLYSYPLCTVSVVLQGYWS